MKKCLGECSLRVTRPDGECSQILVSNPAEQQLSKYFLQVDKIEANLFVNSFPNSLLNCSYQNIFFKLILKWNQLCLFIKQS